MNTQFDSSLAGQRQMRLAKIAQLQQLGVDPYPNKANADCVAIVKLINKFDQNQGQQFSIRGRLISNREHGAIIFADLQDATGKIQLYIKQQDVEPLNLANQTLGWDQIALLDVADHIQATGTLIKTQTGQISLSVTSLKLLSKSIRPIPAGYQGMQDTEERYRRRYLDMTTNPEIRERFVRRGKFWQAIRDVLNSQGFNEVNIPVLEHVTGGADANPFVTHYDSLGQDFYLRISHELPLKRLLGGGFEKVYDIGPRFRNEGFSDEHLPEHVAMEWYWAYANYLDGMKLTQKLFQESLKAVYGKLQFNIKGFEVNLEGEWPMVKYADLLQQNYGVNIFTDELSHLLEILKSKGVELEPTASRGRIVDYLWKQIRKTIAGPIFLIDEPKFSSPLAKSDPANPQVTQRFHAIIAGSELANGYSELNDPVDQLNRFVEQQNLREQGDEEAQMLDIDFVEMLEYGMPPAVGFGLSERVFWFFEDVTAKEGVPFPQLKFELSNSTKDIYKDIAGLLQGSTSDHKPAKQDSKSTSNTSDLKMTIVLSEGLQGWQMANTVGHISTYLGSKTGAQNLLQTQEFLTSTGAIPANSSIPIIVKATKGSPQLLNFLQEVKTSGLVYLAFVKQMMDFHTDAEIQESVKNIPTNDLEYYGIGIIGPTKEVDALTKKFSLWK